MFMLTTARMASMAVVLAAVLLSFVICTRAFVPAQWVDKAQALAELHPNRPSSTGHGVMSEDAILQATRTLFLDNENPNPNVDSTASINALPDEIDASELFKAYFGTKYDSYRTKQYLDAVQEVLFNNAITDLGSESDLSAAHFDGEQILAGQERLTYLRTIMLGEIEEGRYSRARSLLGRMFHTLQDFYSHSNWIDMGARDPHPAIGTPGMIPDNLSPLEQQTCSNCLVKEEVGILLTIALLASFVFRHHAEYIYNCHDNILPSINDAGILTTGYYGGSKDAYGNSISKPFGKCSHGGVIDTFSDIPARGGINKDSLSNVFAALPHLHTVAAEVATKATVQFLEGIRSEIDNDFRYAALFDIGLPNYMGSRKKDTNSNIKVLVTSIAYVIDTTESMNDVLPRIQSALPQMKRELTAYMEDLGDGSNLKYILIPYNDQGPEEVTVVEDVDMFINAIDSLTTGGTSDCNEPTFGALMLALEQSLPRSSVYIFTDAPANDDFRLAEAQALITDKDIEVNFIVTPGCNTQASVYDMYRYIATFSGGQMLTIPNSDVADLAILVTTSARTIHTSLRLPIAGTGSFSKDVIFLVDASVQEVVIIANGGSSLSANLLTPSGDDATTLPEFSVDFQSAYTYIATLNTSMLNLYGEWVLQMSATGTYDARVIGLVDIDFEYSSFCPDSSSLFAYSAITTKPTEDENVTFVIQAVDLDDFSDPTFSFATLWRFDPDISDEELSLEFNDSMEYYGEMEQLLVGSYRLEVTGVNPSLSRVSSRGIHVTDVDLSLGSTQSNFIALFRGQKSTISLSLCNLGQGAQLELSTVKSDASASGFSFSTISPQTVSLGEDECVDVVFTVLAPENIVGDRVASVRLAVVVASTTDVLRNDFVMIDFVASNTIPPDSTKNSTAIPAGTSTLCIMMVLAVIADIIA